MSWFSEIFIRPKSAFQTLNEQPQEQKSLTDYEQLVLQEWYETCVAQYENARAYSSDLYNGFSGKTLISFMKNHSTQDVNIKQKHMEEFLTKKGHSSNRVCGRLKFDGIQIVIWGNVKNGNWGT